MVDDKSITLWHFEDGGEKTVKTIFKNVKFRISTRITKNGIKEKGLHRADSAVVRIMTSDILNISCGDYIQPGVCNGDLPDFTRALKVTAVSDNRRGSVAHWKLFCGG